MRLEPAKSRTAKLIYFSFGVLFLTIGIVGLLLPILPGWLFLLPSAFCFAKSSSFLNKWLRKRKSLQKYFTDENELKQKEINK